MVGSCWELAENCTSVCRVPRRQGWAVSLFNLNKDSERLALRVRVTMFAGRFADVSKRQLAALKVDFSAYSIHEIRAFALASF